VAYSYKSKNTYLHLLTLTTHFFGKHVISSHITIVMVGYINGPVLPASSILYCAH